MSNNGSNGIKSVWVALVAIWALLQVFGGIHNFGQSMDSGSGIQYDTLAYVCGTVYLAVQIIIDVVLVLGKQHGITWELARRIHYYWLLAGFLTIAILAILIVGKPLPIFMVMLLFLTPYLQILPIASLVTADPLVYLGAAAAICVIQWAFCWLISGALGKKKA